MRQTNKYPNWFLALWESGPRILMAVAVLATLLIIVVTIDVESRLNRIENQLDFDPPRSYEAPDLKQLRAEKVPTGPQTVRRYVYAPVYSHVYFLGGSPFLLETTLSIRNIDLARSVFVGSVKYYDTDGRLIKTHVDDPIELAPLQTVAFLVSHQDTSGGSGANFVIEWIAESGVSKPSIETVMVGSAGAQSICFSRDGVEISSAGDETGALRDED